MFTKKSFNLVIIFSVFLLIFPKMDAIAGDLDIDIEESTPDWVAPIIIDVHVTNEKLTPSTSLKVIAELSDGEDGSGVKSANITYKKPSGATKTFNFIFNPSSNKYEATITAEEKDEEGKWEVNNIFIVDKKENERKVYYSTTVKSDETFDYSLMNLYVSETLKQTDFEAPVLTDVTLQSDTVKNGEKIQLTVIAPDNESGVYTATAYYKKTSGKTTTINLNRQSNTDTFIGSHIVKPYDEPGQWTLTSIELIDKVGNRKSYTSYTSADGINKTLEHGYVKISETTLDVETPVLQNVFVQSNNVGNKESIKLTVEATDNLSGVSSMHATYKKSSGGTLPIYLNKEVSTDIFTGTSTIGQYDDLGTYELTSVIVVDFAGNSMTYNRTSLINNGTVTLKQSDVIISGTTPDYEPPLLPGLEMIATKISRNSAEVIFTAKPIDMISGVSSLSGQYMRPDGRSFNLNFNKVGNVYVAKLPIDKFDQLGKWRLTTISISDNRGNRRTIYYNTEENYFTVSKGKINIPPGVPYDIMVATELNMQSGETYQLNPILKNTDGSERDIISDSHTQYTSSNPTAVTIGKTGIIKVNDKAKSSKVYVAVTYGDITKAIWITINGGSNDIQLEVTPLKTNLSSGQQQQINVIEVNAGGRKDISFSGSGISYASSNPSLVTVSKDGLIMVTSGSSTGVVVIKVSYEDLDTEVTIQVTKPTVQSLAISPNEESMSLNDNSLQLIVKGFMSNGTTKDVTAAYEGTKYTSSNPEIAQVSADGLITIPSNAKSGVVTIQVSNNNLVVKSMLQVTGNPELVSMNLDSIPSEMTVGEQKQISLKSEWSDGSIKDVNFEDVKFVSSRTDRVSISAKGLVQSASIGASNIEISYNGKIFSTVIKVLPLPAIKNFYLKNPLVTQMKIGEEISIPRLKVELSNGEIRDIDVMEVTLSSSRSDRISVTEDGTLKALASGSSNINIKYGVKAITTTIKVEAGPTVSSIYLEKEIPSEMKIGDEHTIDTVKAKWSNGDETIISSTELSFISSRPDRISVSENGELVALSSGGSNIDINYKGKNIRVSVKGNIGPSLSSIYLETKPPVTMNIGYEYTIGVVKAKWSNGDETIISNTDLSFTSSRPDRILVTEDGNLTALFLGASNIDINYAGKNIRVSVKGIAN